MPATVVVLLPATDTRGPDARALAGACTAALRDGECVVRESAPTTAIAVATVTVRAEGKIHIDVDVRATSASPSRHPSRDLTFRDADPIEERWKSVGFAIASMSGAAVDVEPESEGVAPHTTPPPSTGTTAETATAAGASNATTAGTNAATPSDVKNAAASAPAAALRAASAPKGNGPTPRAPASAPPQKEDEEPGARRFRASGELETGPGLTHGTWRVGGALGLGYDFYDGFWGIDALGSYAATPTDVSGVDVSWLTFGAGASVAWTLYGVRGRVGALIGARELRASESDATTGRHESLTRWLPVGIVRASLAWPATRLLGMFSGLELRRTSGGTAIESHGTYIGSSPALEFGFFGGVEVRL